VWKRRREYVIVLVLGTVTILSSVALSLAANAGTAQERWPGWLDILRREPWWSIAALLSVTIVVSAVLLRRERWVSEPATKNDVVEAADRIQLSVDHVGAAMTAFGGKYEGIPPFPSNLLTRAAPDEQMAIWKVVSAFTSETTDPGKLALEWAAAPPQAIGDLSAVGRLVVAELLLAHRQQSAALDQFREAVRLGASPRAFWLVRMAQVAGSEDGPPTITAESLLDEAAQVDPDYPLLRALRLLRSEDARGAEEILIGWEPSTPWEVDTRLTFLSSALYAQDRLDDAIAVLDEGIADTRNASLLLSFARVLSARSVAGGGDSRWQDAFQAIEVAVRARNLRRSWRGDSAEAVVMAGEAAIIGDAPKQVWTITRPPPEGEATEQEANDPRVLPVAAMGAALNGRVDQARELVAHAPEGFPRKRIEAELASHPAVSGETPAADAWVDAYQAATTDQEKLHALRGLAMEGAIDRVNIGELRTRHPDAIAEIEANSEVMSIAGPQADIRLRELEHLNPLASLRRAEILRTSDPQHAANVLVDANDRWNDPRLLLMAIDCYVDAGDWSQAAELASQAIANVGILWPGRATVLRRILDIQTMLANWPKVATASRHLLELDPNDIDARWSLAHALFRDGDPEEAWRSVNRTNLSTDVSNPQRAMFLMELVRRHATADQVAQTALTMLRSFPNDHDVHATAIHTVAMRRDQTELPEDLGTQISEAQVSFFTLYPDSTVLTNHRIRDDGQPLADIAPDLRQRAATYQDALAAVQEKTLPIGILGQAFGKPYAAIFLYRPLGYHHAAFSQDADIATELEIARSALTDTCFIDASALYTLTLLPDHDQVLLALAQRPTITDAALRDLLVAEDLLSLPTQGTFTFDPATNEVAAIRNNPDVTRRQQQQIQAMLTSARRLRRLVHPVLRHLRPLRQEQEHVWLLTLDAAKHTDSAIWADDIGLRQFAHSLGIKTFGTQSVLKLAQEQQLLDRAHIDRIHHDLVCEDVVDLPIDPAAMLEIAAEQDWKPRSMATVLSRPASWVNVELAVTMFQAALQHSPRPMLTTWAHAALHGLTAASPPAHYDENIRGLVATVLADHATRPDQVSALIAALYLVAPDDVDAVTHSAMDRAWTYLKSIYSIENATTVFLYVISELDERHRQHAVRLILQPDNPESS
jgi:tetratricopeptide (TPR) repeat protein